MYDDLDLHAQVVQLKGLDLEAPLDESSQSPPTTKHLCRGVYHVALPHLFQDLMNLKFDVYCLSLMFIKDIHVFKVNKEPYLKYSDKTQATFQGFRTEFQHDEH